MLYLEAPYFHIGRLSVLRDHADPLQFYYYPLAPRIARHADGSPAFLFVKYKTDPDRLPAGATPGGGMLSFDVDLGAEEDELDEARSEIRRQLRLEDTPRLAPLDYRSGRVRLILLDFEEPPPDDEEPARPASGEAEVEPAVRFVEKAAYSATPSLYGDNRAAFSVQLTAEGATLVEQTLDMASSLIGVVYDMRFVGLRPAYHVRLDVDWDRVMTFLEERFKANAIWFGVDIDEITQELIEDRTIRFEVIRFVADGTEREVEARADEATQFVRDFIKETFFEPSVDPKEAISDRWWEQIAMGVQSFNPTFGSYTRRDFTRIDKKSLNIDFTEQSAVQRQIVPQGHLQGLAKVLEGLPRDQFIREVDLDDPFFERLQVRVTTPEESAVDKLEAVKVHLEYGDEPRDVLLRDPRAEETVVWSLDPSRGLDYRYSFEIFFKPDAPPGPVGSLRSETVTTNETTLVIDPRRLYGRQQVKVQAAPDIDFNRYPAIEAELRYRDPEAALDLRHSLVLTDQGKDASWAFRLADPRRTGFQYRTTFFRTGGEPITSDWRESADSTVLLTDPLPNALQVTVVPAVDFERVLKLFVVLEYDDAANAHHIEQLMDFDAAGKTLVWNPRIVDPTRRDYRWRATFLYRDGTSREQPWARASESLLVVNETFQRTRVITVGAEGEPFDRARVSRVQIALSYEDLEHDVHERTEITLRSLDDRAQWSFTIHDPARDRYRYEVTIVQSDGFRRRLPAQQSADETLLIRV